MVSVIIPTTCEKAREESIRRALASVYEQASEVVVVVNGERSDSSLLKQLRADTRLIVLQLTEGNVSKARLAGLRRSTSPFFCFLDDDDEFLPGALAQRMALFEDRVDVVVTNGYEHRHGSDQPLVPPAIAATANSDPAGSFLSFNWFASPASMFRASTVGQELLDIKLRHFEWTHLFFSLLLAGKSIRYGDCLTYRKFEDNPLSVSKSAEYAQAYPSFLRSLSTMDLDSRTKGLLKAKTVVALNGLSVMELARGRRRAAWKAHAQCIAMGGWRYVPYTRRLLAPSWA